MVLFSAGSPYAPYIIIPIVTWLLIILTGRHSPAAPNALTSGTDSADGDSAFIHRQAVHSSVGAGDEENEEEEATTVGPARINFADSNVDERVKSAVNCLKSHGTYKDGCWWNLRREVSLATLEYLASLPVEELKEFSYENSGQTDPSGGYHGWLSMDLIVPTYECNTNRIRKIGGGGDGGKWFCGDLKQMLSDMSTTRTNLRSEMDEEVQPESGAKKHADCIIYSLGSNNQFGFEAAVKGEVGSTCDIHTFDCTGNWSHPSTTFHSWCLGRAPDNEEEARKPLYKSFFDITKELGHEYVSFLKMDTEGAEYEVFDSMLTPENSHRLPVVIMVEFHSHLYTNLHLNARLGQLDKLLPPSYAEGRNWVRPMWELVKKLDEYGYVVVMKERNEWDPRQSKCCTEVLLMRIKDVQGLNFKKLSGFGRWVCFIALILLGPQITQDPAAHPAGNGSLAAKEYPKTARLTPGFAWDLRTGIRVECALCETCTE